MGFGWSQETPKGGGLKSVCCQICGEEIALVHPLEVEARIKSGEYATHRVTASKTWGGGTTYSEQEGVFGMCRKCRGEQGNLPIRGDSAAQADAQHRRIMERIRYIRSNQPEMSLKEAAMRATEDEFEPANEPNGAFRAYLLERGAPVAPKFWEPIAKWLRGLFV